MSGTPWGSDSRRAPIPPIEIGAFTAPRPDRSEFIGSASGAFFVNTVFRAFAAAAIYSGTEEAQDAVAPLDPGSAHSYLTEVEGAQAQAVDDDAILNAISLAEEAETPGERSYGVTAPGLGRPPHSASAKSLIMFYFRNWHPFFPFLHGPTFFEDVDRFYNPGIGPSENENTPLSLRSKLCRAVTFQCIFNLAAIGQDSTHLEATSRIKSAAALTHLLGAISTNHDISSLQALLAAELYLTSTMSLRAASTIHGSLTRILYQSGFHRCPFRFVQLPHTMYDIRKRIFWCAYVLDRYLSQALGYPVAIRDDEVDVCVPGMAELHKPVKPREQTSPSLAVPGDDTREHLPEDRSGRGHPRSVTGMPLSGEDGIAETEDAVNQSPAYHHNISPNAAGEYVLGYLVTYSRLIGAVLDLFHKSIHKRSITWDKVLEITCRTHAWWNSLPSVFQDDLEGEATGGNLQFGPFFSILYHHLILLINRPLLSLPTCMIDFRSSLQSALSASRSILMLSSRRRNACLVRAWPGTLSATWMAGLVIAFAGLLGLYPHEKAIADLISSLALLDELGNNWGSARHCHTALKVLLERLMFRPSPVQPNRSPSTSTRVPSDAQNGAQSSSSRHPAQEDGANERHNSKRRRYNTGRGTQIPNHFHGQGEVAGHSLGADPTGLQDWQPVLEYTGPDFGFDAEQFVGRGEWQFPVNQNFDAASGPLFNNAGFEAYVQYFGDRLNF